MSVSQGCNLFGVDQALSGIKDAVILYHTVISCSFATTTFKMATNMKDIRRTCSVISEKEVVFGGEENLEKAIEKINKLYDYNLLIIISGCVSEIIADDIDAVVRNNSDKKIIYVNGAGFMNDYDGGFEKALYSLSELMEEKTYTKKNMINIIGIESDAYLKEGDIKEIRELIGDDFQLNFIGSDCFYKEIKTASSASLNIVLDRGLELAKYMKDHFDIPYKQINYPYGILGSFKLLKVIEEEFNIDYKVKKEQMKKEVAGQIEKVYGYLQSIYQTPIAIIAGRSRLEGMRYMLEEELGLEVMNTKYKEDIDLLEEFYEEIINTDVSILFGSSFDKDFALNNNILYMPFDYPVFDRIDLTNKTYIGAKGSLQIIEDLLNQIHMSKTKRGALYK